MVCSGLRDDFPDTVGIAESSALGGVVAENDGNDVVLLKAGKAPDFWSLVLEHDDVDFAVFFAVNG